MESLVLTTQLGPTVFVNYLQDRECTYNVILRGVLATIVAVKKQ